MQVQLTTPCTAKPSALLKNYEVAAIVPFDEVDRSAKTRDTSSNDDHSGLCMILVAHWHLRPGHLASHVGEVQRLVVSRKIDWPADKVSQLINQDSKADRGRE
jgi:hypothetical protein